jgi:transcriptional regulator with XRE-family HTH domain
MLNTDDFKERLEKLFDFYELTPATFAEQIGVQRSSLSHLLSGRNKPSLDFILKIEASFEAVELNWLLHGKGNFPKNLQNEIGVDLPQSAPIASLFDAEKVIPEKDSKDLLPLSEAKKPTEEPKIEFKRTGDETIETASNQSKIDLEAVSTNLKQMNTKKIIQVMFFYEDGTFEGFSPKQNPI